MPLSGGLKEPRGFSQVDAKSHVVLASINGAGMITHDSQSGADSTERAYVAGWIPTVMAERFLREINARGVVAWGLPPVQKTHATSVRLASLPVTMSRAGEVRTRAHMHATAKDLADLARTSGVASFRDITHVDCVDPRWGRDASGRSGLFREVLRALKRAQIA